MTTKWSFACSWIKAVAASKPWVAGDALLGLGDFHLAEERLAYALERARATDFVEEELASLIGLAKLNLSQGDKENARLFLDDVWELAERGPYPLIHADALNVLTKLELSLANIPNALSSAKLAYILAWCDGPPYWYHWGIQEARRHLTVLNEPEPDLLLFRSIHYQEIPDININLVDEFYVDLETE